MKVYAKCVLRIPLMREYGTDRYGSLPSACQPDGQRILPHAGDGIGQRGVQLSFVRRSGQRGMSATLIPPRLPKHSWRKSNLYFCDDADRAGRAQRGLDYFAVRSVFIESKICMREVLR